MNKLMKKIAVVIAAAALGLSATGAAAFANDGTGVDAMGISISDCSKDMKVISSTAMVRENPTTESRSLHELANGTAVHVDGITSNGWYRIWTNDPVYGGQTAGYIRSDLLSENGTGQQSGIKVGNVYSTHVNTGYLALRTAPAYNENNEIGPLWNGSEVQVIGTGSNGYVLVRVNYSASGQYGQNLAGQSGYVNASYLQ